MTTQAMVETTPSPDQALIQLFVGMWPMQAIATAAMLGIPDYVGSGQTKSV